MNDHTTHANGERPEGNPDSIKVLMYHRIVDDETLCQAHWTCLHVNDFKKHLEVLDHYGFTTITFEDYRLFQAGEINLPKKPIIITFDDGYRDTYEHALPVLRQFGMTAVVFVLGDRNITSNVWDCVNGVPPAPLLNPEQIIELHEMGFEIGAHSLRHSKLTHLCLEEAWEEITRSRMLLEILLNAPVRTFSYPYGLVDSKVKKLVADAGYTHACSVFSGPPTFTGDNFEIRRIAVPSNLGAVNFSLRITSGYRYFEWARWKTKNIFSNGRNGERKNGREEHHATTPMQSDTRNSHE